MARDALRALPDHHASGRRGGLEPRGGVRHVSDHRVVLDAALRADAADQHEPALDADAHRDLPAARDAGGIAGRDRGGEFEPAGHGGLRVAPERAGIAEGHQDAVADIARDMPAMTPRAAHRRLAIGDEEVGELLRVHPRGEPGRAHEVAEQHRDVPPLSARGRRHGRDPGAAGRAEARAGRHRATAFAAVLPGLRLILHGGLHRFPFGADTTSERGGPPGCQLARAATRLSTGTRRPTLAPHPNKGAAMTATARRWARGAVPARRKTCRR